jgi:2-methylcitrate dehydratase
MDARDGREDRDGREHREEGDVRPRVPGLDRRDLMKMGAGVVMMALNPRSASTQDRAPRPVAVTPHTETGWKTDASRASGNGPMDNTTRQIVHFVSSFSESNLTDPVVHALNRTMVDSIAALISGFESEPARIGVRLARTIRSDLKSTVLGYGVTTSPELAAFVNGCMLRHADFNDQGPGGHLSDIISGILAIGEALHSTGPQVLAAVTIGYELTGALGEARRVVDGPAYTGGWDGPFEGPAMALAAGKLMGLNEDQLANAFSLALVPHMPMSVTHVGHLSHWKGCHSSESIKCAVWAALLAREGMTGPAQPFEARNGLFDHMGAFRELRFPMSSDGQLVVQMVGVKRTPTEASSQATLELIPQIRAWTKVEDIASIQHEMPFFAWQEIADPPKWDPQNRETADHSIPYMIARALIDGELYLDSFTPEKFRDPAVRRLMEKITVRPNPDWTGNAPSHITVRTKSGAEKSWDSMGGRRHFGTGEFNTPMSDEEITAKFNRVCAFMHVEDEQRDRARDMWSNLQAVRDIAEPMRALAKFGQPLPL